MALVAVLYGAAGQAGGSGFVAVMTFAHFGTTDIRGTAFFLNIVAAAYATLQVHRARLADWKLQWLLLAGSVPCAALGGMIPLQGRAYYALTGLILFTVAGLMMLRRARPEGEAIGSSTAIGIGAITGLASGVTGVGGGVFLSSLLILLGKASPKSTMSLSPPFILANSAAALGGPGPRGGGIESGQVAPECRPAQS